ncbi:MAG: family 16 glycoside hydrolase [Fuerstiella sp.]
MSLIRNTTAVLLSSFLLSAACVGQAPANSELVVDETFDGKSLDAKTWKVGVGEWKIEDGVLKGAEVPADKHAAALRRIVETQNAVYELKFRFTGNAKAFHLGFDPAKGELDKKGHLFSVIVTPESWKIMKHADKNDPKANPNKNLVVSQKAFAVNQWYSLRITTWGPYVTAKIDGDEVLKTSDPTFSVRKPTLVFRCLGDGVQVSDLKVYRQVKE